MDREQMKIIHEAKGGSRSARSTAAIGTDIRALAKARAKLVSGAARGASAVSAESLRALAASYRARKGA